MAKYILSLTLAEAALTVRADATSSDENFIVAGKCQSWICEADTGSH